MLFIVDNRTFSMLTYLFRKIMQLIMFVKCHKCTDFRPFSLLNANFMLTVYVSLSLRYTGVTNCDTSESLALAVVASP